MIRNPILPGFNPDPSICRVGNDYYIATSTFEWYPGVQIHHSTDLVNWALIKRPLDRASQLDMRGNPDSGGIWAPCLSYADGVFWLVYTDVKRYSRNFKDTHNYIVTAPAIEGPWSDPSYVNSSGFDPSLFHDDDGRKWFMNMCFNYRNDPIGGGVSPHSGFAGILMQQWDAQSKKLVGQAKNVFRGSALALVEGAHIFKRRGWYYMTVAEGGTGYDHAVTMARARSILGPYELHPEVHLITSKDTPGAALQRAGHGQMVETPDGLVYHTHLCSRPLPQSRCSPLGRETAIQRCEWHDDDWLYLANGSYIPDELVASPDPEIRPNAVELHHHRFDSKRLPIEFQWLRTPYPDRLFSLSEKGLTLYGRESIGSWFEQSLVARRQEHFSCRVETEVDFNPSNQQQVAGLTHYYNQHKYHAIVVTWHERYGRVLNIFSCAADWPDGKLTFPLPEPIPLHIDGPLQLAADIDLETLQFQWRGRGGDWQKLGPVLNAGLISDESGRGPFGSFTGAFVGMFAFDLSGTARDAVFKSFSYMPGGSAS